MDFSQLFVLTFVLIYKVTVAQEAYITLMPPDIRQNLGDGVVVACLLKVPNPELVSSVEWRGPEDLEIPTLDGSITTLEGLDSQNQLDLFIKHLRLEDVGVYTCNALYAGNQKLSKNITVKYYRDIDFKDTETLQKPVKGSDAKIRCVVTSDPPARVDWLKDGVPIKDDRIIQQNDGILIKAITARDEGVYRCRARVQALGEISYKDIQVEVHEMPVMTGPPKDTEGIEKESIKFECIATGKPAPTYEWVNKDSELLNDKEGYYVDIRTGELTILELRPEQTGNYRCTASNDAGDATAEAHLRVLMKPKIESHLNITVAQGSEAKMLCTVSGDPLPKVMFKKETNGEPFSDGLSSNGNVRVTQETDDQGWNVGVMTILNLGRTDDGLYTCTGNSTGGVTVSWGHITVEFPPTFEDQPQDDFWSAEQEPVNVTCLATSIPNATIEWFLHEEPIRASDKNLQILVYGPNGMLRVHPIDSSYFDDYRCKATNIHGVAEHTVSLHQVRKPGPLSSTQANKKTATTVTWSIRDPLDDGGRPVIGYMVQFRLSNYPWDEAEEKFWTKGSTYMVDRLTPLESYVFRFAAVNDVGNGQWSGEKSVDIPKRSAPEEPLMYSVDPKEVNQIPYTDHYKLQWQVPLDNGEIIDYFEIIYYQVRNSTGSWSFVGDKDSIEVKSPGQSSHRIDGLKPDSFYRVELRAHNKIGFSTPAEAYIKTANGEATSTNTSRPASNSGVITAIVIIVILLLLVVIDVIMYFTKDVGFTAFIVRKVASPAAEKDKEAIIEEGKNNAKADDNSNKAALALKEDSKEKDCSERTPMINGESDKEAIKNEEKAQEMTTAATNEALSKDSAV